MATELKPKRRTKATPEELEASIEAAQNSPEYVSPLREYTDDEYAQMDEAAAEMFQDVADPDYPPTGGEPPLESLPDAPYEAPKKPWTPRDEHMVDVRGGAKYLPARRRVQWMRQEPQPHPDWAIKTTIVNFVMGEIQSPQKVTGGYASFKAEIYDEYGRLISSGHAQEFSENFFDYLEKAETSAVARALALAGYGTETALDLDEGFIADSPFKQDGQMIRIESSNVPGLKQGGRSEHATEAQIDAVRRRARELQLDPGKLKDIIEMVTGDSINLDMEANPAAKLIEAIRKVTFEQAGEIVQMLQAALTADEQAELENQ